MGTIVKLNTVQEYNIAMGVETLHPLVSVVDFSTLKSLKHGRKNFGFYCVFLKQLKCGELSYGRSTYDYQEGTLVFVAPGQVAGIDDDVFATIVYPTLTTMKIDVEEKATVAVDILMKLIQGETCTPYIHKTKVQLIERESVKKLQK